MWIKLARWVFFSVLIALVPLIGSYVVLFVKGKPPTLAEFLADGGLLLIASALSASALGELIGSKTTYVLLKIAASGANVILLLLSTAIFASISEARLSQSTNGDAVETTSIVIFLVGFLLSSLCIALSEV